MSKLKIETIVAEVERQFKIYKRWKCTLFRRNMMERDSWIANYCNVYTQTEGLSMKEFKSFQAYMEDMIECCRVIPTGKDAGCAIGVFGDIVNRLKFDPKYEEEVIDGIAALSFQANLATDAYIHEAWEISQKTCYSKNILDMNITAKREKKAMSRAVSLSFMYKAYTDGVLLKAIDYLSAQISDTGDWRIFNLITTLRKWVSWQNKMERKFHDAYIRPQVQNALTALPYMRSLPDGKCFVYLALAEICESMKNETNAKDSNQDTVKHLLESLYL